LRNLYLHVGHPKCGSTSLQESLKSTPDLLYPKSGVNGAEHLSLPLYIKGIDEWTGQFFDQEWVKIQHQLMLQEIAASDLDVFVSSERLASMSDAQIRNLKELFPGFNIIIIIVKRDIEKYLNSTWRHAVYNHDYAEDYDDFMRNMQRYSFDDCEKRFSEYHRLCVFDMDSDEYPKNLGKLLHTEIVLPKSNVGVPLEFAKLLQLNHKLMGSKKFKEIFDYEEKKKMLDVLYGQTEVQVDDMNVNLF
jgi:hypothetical protein